MGLGLHNGIVRRLPFDAIGSILPEDPEEGFLAGPAEERFFEARGGF